MTTNFGIGFADSLIIMMNNGLPQNLSSRFLATRDWLSSKFELMRPRRLFIALMALGQLASTMAVANAAPTDKLIVKDILAAPELQKRPRKADLKSAPRTPNITKIDAQLSAVKSLSEYLNDPALQAEHYRALEAYFGYRNPRGFSRFYQQVIEQLKQLEAIDPALTKRFFKSTEAAPDYSLSITHDHKQLQLNAITLQIFVREQYPYMKEEWALDAAKKLKTLLASEPKTKWREKIESTVELQDAIFQVNAYAFRRFLEMNPQIEKIFPKLDLSKESLLDRFEFSELIIAEYERFYQVEHAQILSTLGLTRDMIRSARKELVPTQTFINEHSIFSAASDISHQVWPRPLNPKLKRGVYQFVPVRNPFNAIFMRFGSDSEEFHFLRWSSVILDKARFYTVENHGAFAGYVQETPHLYLGKKTAVDKQEVIYLTEVKLPLLNGGQAIVKDAAASAKINVEEWLSALPGDIRRMVGGSDIESKHAGTSHYRVIYKGEKYVNPSKENVLDPDKGQEAIKRYMEKHQISDFDYGRNFQIQDQASVARLQKAAQTLGLSIADIPKNELLSTLYFKPKDRVWLLDEVTFDQYLRNTESFRAALRSKKIDQDVLLDRLMQISNRRHDYFQMMEVAIFELQRESGYGLHKILEWLRYYADYKTEVLVLKHLFDNQTRLIRSPLIARILSVLEFETNARGDLTIPPHAMEEANSRLDKIRGVEYNFDIFVEPVERADEVEFHREKYWENFQRFFADLPVDLQQFTLNYLSAKYAHQESAIKLFKKYFTQDWYGAAGSNLKIQSAAKNPLTEMMKAKFATPLLCYQIFQ